MVVGCRGQGGVTGLAIRVGNVGGTVVGGSRRLGCMSGMIRQRGLVVKAGVSNSPCQGFTGMAATVGPIVGKMAGATGRAGLEGRRTPTGAALAVLAWHWQPLQPHARQQHGGQQENPKLIQPFHRIDRYSTLVGR